MAVNPHTPMMTACVRSPHVGDLLARYDTQSVAGEPTARLVRVTQAGPDWFAYHRSVFLVATPEAEEPRGIRVVRVATTQPTAPDDAPASPGKPVAEVVVEAVCCLVHEDAWNRWHYLNRFDGGRVTNADAAEGEEGGNPPGPPSSRHPTCVSFNIEEENG